MLHFGAMKYERVHAVWDYYDGVRTGVADIDGAPHYFAARFDAVEDEYSDLFTVYPVNGQFMEHVARQWTIFRNWQRRYHSGEIGGETHPGHGGLEAEYVNLTTWLDAQVMTLRPLPTLYRAEFRAVQDQEPLPRYMLRDLEVTWAPIPTIG